MLKAICCFFLAATLIFGKDPQAAPKNAEITVFQSKDLSACPLALNKMRVYIDGKGRRLPCNRFFTVAVPPGKHIISSGAGYLMARREHLDLHLKAGQHIWILEGLQPGVWQGRLSLRIVSCYDFAGRHLTKKLKPLKKRQGVLPEKTFPEPYCSLGN